METARLKLELLAETHIPEIFAAVGTDPESYRWLPFPAPQNLSDFSRVLRGFITDTHNGLRIAHAVILKSNGLAIGVTLYGEEYRRTFVNSECKLLLLTEAFEVRGVERVTLKTDSMNERSQAAILRLGAIYEGVLRHHMKRPDGSWRDSVYFSILRSEWPLVKANLESKIFQVGGA
jgi:hypothetical protein